MAAVVRSTIPDAWKHPFGNWHQAPPEYGGGWWQVSPFTGPEPWKTQNTGQGIDPEVLPFRFDLTFGPKPKAEDFRGRGGNAAFQAALAAWENNLKHWKQYGWPDWATEDEIRNAAFLFKNWNMGQPRPYEGRYGFMVRFPESALPDFDESAYAVLKSGHHVVARYQIKLAQAGATVSIRHPFVPPQVFGDDKVD